MLPALNRASKAVIPDYSKQIARSFSQKSSQESSEEQTIRKILAAGVYLTGFGFTTALYAHKRSEWIDRAFIDTPYANDITPWGAFPNKNFPSPHREETDRSYRKCPLVGAFWPVTLPFVLKMDPYRPYEYPCVEWLFY